MYLQLAIWRTQTCLSSGYKRKSIGQANVNEILEQKAENTWNVLKEKSVWICKFNLPMYSSRTNNQEELFDQILSGLFEFNSPDWDDISYPAKELISWMLQVDPLQRYSAYEILQHPWIKGHSMKWKWISAVFTKLH